jgi:hypothetical protein
VLDVQPCQKWMNGVPPKRGNVASRMDIGAYPTSDLGCMVMGVCMRNEIAWVCMEVEVST